MRLGQHFLRDGAVLEAVLDAAAIEPGERVLEIGPGEGVLTRPLVAHVAPGEVVAVEADPALVKALRAAAIPHLRIEEGDVMQVDLVPLGPFSAIVANLPYQISGPVTARLVESQAALGWTRMVLMFQAEFALRLLALPGTRDYGRLSVLVQRVCTVTKVRDVPPGAFAPPPKVDSMVVKLVPKRPVPVRDERLLRAIVDRTFQARRKQLRNSLPPAVAGFGIPREKAIEALADDASRRPEELSVEEFCALVDRLC